MIKRSRPALPQKSVTRVIYIHGFNSSADSQKAQLFSHYCTENFPGLDLCIPTLSYDPEQAMTELEQQVMAVDGEIGLLVGSSLGGYYATYLSEKYALKAALINPAVLPCRNTGNEFLGLHTNYYTGETYELNMKHVDYLRSLEVDVLQYPDNYLLLVQTGDEVLDYQLAVAYYQQSIKIIQDGGNHGFVNFAAVLPEIFKFAEINH